MPGIKIILIEDDWIIAKEIAYSLQDIGFEVIGTYDSGEEGFEQIKSKQPDLVLLDIDLSGEQTGIDIGRKLKEETTIPFIFLTALVDSNTIKQAKLVEPYGYLVKPIKPETLYSTIEITLHNAAHRKTSVETPFLKEGLTIEESIFVKAKHRLEKLLLKDILWVEASDIYALICTTEGKHLLNTSLKVVEEKFPSSKFIRVHRSYIINLDKIEAIEEYHLIINNNKVPIGKTYRDKLMARLFFI